MFQKIISGQIKKYVPIPFLLVAFFMQQHGSKPCVRKIEFLRNFCGSWMTTFYREWASDNTPARASTTCHTQKNKDLKNYQSADRDKFLPGVLVLKGPRPAHCHGHPYLAEGELLAAS